MTYHTGDNLTAWVVDLTGPGPDPRITPFDVTLISRAGTLRAQLVSHPTKLGLLNVQGKEPAELHLSPGDAIAATVADLRATATQARIQLDRTCHRIAQVQALDVSTLTNED